MKTNSNGRHFSGNDLSIQRDKTICDKMPQLCDQLEKSCNNVCTNIADCFKCYQTKDSNIQSDNVKGSTHPEDKTLPLS